MIWDCNLQTQEDEPYLFLLSAQKHLQQQVCNREKSSHCIAMQTRRLQGRIGAFAILCNGCRTWWPTGTNRSLMRSWLSRSIPRAMVGVCWGAGILE
jgi:hypothetical protein